MPYFIYSQIAQHAAKKAPRKIKEEKTTDFHNPNIFRESYTDKKPFKIERVREYRNGKLQAVRSDWKISGPLDLFQVNDVITKLADEMTAKLPDNVKLQVSLVSNVDDKITQTKLQNKNEVGNKLSDWVHFFIDYRVMELENITFKLLAEESPTGAGRVNTIITAGSKRSITQVKNVYTICLARAIVVGLAVNNKEKFQTLLGNKLTEEELNNINLRRHNKAQNNQGILSDNEEEDITKGRKLQTVLAQALHRMSNIPMKPQENDFQDAKLFEEALDISVHIYYAESRQIYEGIDRSVNVNIFMSDTHYDIIFNLSRFTCQNDRDQKAKLKCKACNSAIKCDVSHPASQCRTCYKFFYAKIRFDNHIKNKKCKEHSYKWENVTDLIK